MKHIKIFALALATLFTTAAGAQTRLDNNTTAPHIILPGDTITLGYNNDLAVVPINATCDYTVGNTSTWLRAQKDSNGNLAIFSQFNLDGNDRYATLTLTSADSALTKTLVVDQKGNTMDGATTLSSDSKVGISSSTDNQHQPGQDISNTLDGNNGTLYHSPWGGTTFPVVLTYNFTSPSHVDYALYTPRQDGNNNGNWQQVTVQYETKYGTWETLGTYNFGGVGDATKVRFGENGLDSILAVRYTVNSGANNFASCAEMAFYYTDSTTTNYLRQYFADDLCTTLKPGITEKDALKIKDQFIKRLVYTLLQGNYSTKFRVGEFRAWRPVSSLRAELKNSHPYCNHENPTGIFAQKGERLAVIVEGIKDYAVGLKIRNFGPTDYESSDYTLTNGVNIITAANKGNLYVNYWTEDYKNAPKVKIHFAMCTENGYFDITKGMTNTDWKELLANAKGDCMDVLGYHCQVNFPVSAFRENCPDGEWLIHTYDSIVSAEHEMMGLYHYNREYGNHQTVICVAKSAGLYHASGDGMCVPFNALEQPSSSNPSRFDYWGAGHELGHNNQTDGILWIGLTEVTNNCLAAYAQDRVQPNGFHRMENESRGEKDYNFVNKIVMPNLIKADSVFHQAHDVWSTMEPFWIIHCYTYAAGVDSLAYPKIFEKMRTMDLPQKNNGIGQNANYTADGEQQLNFVKQTCDMTQIDFSEFFHQAGMIMPHNSVIGDYANRRLLITQAMCDTLQNYIDSKHYVKAPAGLYLINIYNTAAFRNKQVVPEGITPGTGCSLSGNTLTIRHSAWPNVVGFKVYDTNGKLIEIGSYGHGYQGSDNNYRPSYTTVTYGSNVGRVTAVSYDGTERLCYGN